MKHHKTKGMRLDSWFSWEFVWQSIRLAPTMVRGRGRRRAPGSGSRSDGKRKQKQKQSKYAGVQVRGVTVEVKKWYMSSGGERVGFYRGVNMSEMNAAVLRDLVILHSNPGCAKQLNIDDVVQDIQGPALMVDLKGRGREWLVQWVEGKPLEHAREGWERLDEGQKEKLKQEIEDQVPAFLVFLKEKIACERFKAGRERTALDQILAPVVENDPIQELNELRAIVSEKDAEIASLKEVKDAEIASLKEVKDAEIASLKQERDEALKAMDAAQKGRGAVMEELYAAKEAARAASATPLKSGVAEREEFPQTQETQEPNGTFGYAAGKYEIAFSNEVIGAKNVAPKEMASCEGIELPDLDRDLDFSSFLDLDAFLQDDDSIDSFQFDNDTESAVNKDWMNTLELDNDLKEAADAWRNKLSSST